MKLILNMFVYINIYKNNYFNIFYNFNCINYSFPYIEIFKP